MIPTKKNVRTITDMRERALKLLKEVSSSKEPIYIFNRSDPQAVLLGVESFKDLIEELEDARDTRELEEAIDSSGGEFVDFEEFDQKRRRDLGLDVQSKDRQESPKKVAAVK